jgi:putative spermidine/putrescine transport system ATP-binding protein
MLDVREVEKRYGDTVALHPTSISVQKGEFLTLLGPSGSGKSTLLSLISGLSEPDGGAVLIDGTDVTYGAPNERGIGMVFQNYALFPHLTVAENVAFPLRLRRIDTTRRAAMVERALKMVDLPHLSHRFPRELSGGQQQRIALARCIVYEPSIILMDEPLGALDKRMRDQMQFEIRRIHRELGATILYVTHDQEEAMTMSDRICLMRAGRIEQIGTPDDLYFRPQTAFVADFVGESNLFDGVVSSVAGNEVSVTWRDMPGTAIGRGNGARYAVGDPVHVMVRPQNMVLQSSAGARVAPGNAASATNEAPAPAMAANTVAASLIDFYVAGDVSKYRLQLPSGDSKPIGVTTLTQLARRSLAVGDSVVVRWQTEDAVVIPRLTADADGALAAPHT